LDKGEELVVEGVGEILGLPKSGFERAEAAQTPEVLSEFINQDFFGGIGGLVLSAKFGAQFIEFNGALVGQHEGFGIDTVLKGVLRAALFAFGAAGTGGFAFGRLGDGSGLGYGTGFLRINGHERFLAGR
jgi:hypothetical protein